MKKFSPDLCCTKVPQIVPAWIVLQLIPWNPDTRSPWYQRGFGRQTWSRQYLRGSAPVHGTMMEILDIIGFTSAFTVIFSPFLRATAYCGTRFLNPSMIFADFDSWISIQFKRKLLLLLTAMPDSRRKCRWQWRQQRARSRGRDCHLEAPRRRSPVILIIFWFWFWLYSDYLLILGNSKTWMP